MKNKLGIYYRPIYTYWKSHKCLKCGDKAIVDYTIKVVNPDSDEFNEYASAYDETYPIGDVEVKEVVFTCRRCDFKANEITYYNIEKIISRMEKKDSKCHEDIQIRYLYEENILYAFSKKWSCKKCNTKVRLDYEVIEVKEPYYSFFNSFRRNNNIEDKVQLRKLYYECENCCAKTYVNEIEEGVNVVKHRISSKLIAVAQLITLILIVLIYLLIKR